MSTIVSTLFNKLPLSFKDSGMQALVVTKLFGNVIRLLSNLLLARFLSPDAFAIFGLAFTVIFAFEMISDGGFRAFILKHKDGDEKYLLKTLWTIKLIRNAILAILLYTSSGYVAEFFMIPELSLVLKVMCLCFFAESLIPIGFIAIERQNRIARVMYVRFACMLLSVIFSVVGVYLTGSYWLVIASMVLNPTLQIILGLIFIGSHGTGFYFDRAIIFEFLHWAKFIIPSSIITLLLLQFDKVVLGRILSVSELGLYFIAFSVASAAKSFTVEYARGVLQPYLSIVYREMPEQYLEKNYGKKQKIILFIAVGLGALCGASYLFFDLLYPDEYISAGFYLSLLLVTPIMTLITYPSEVSLILYGQLKTTLIANIIRLVWFVVGAACSYFWWGAMGLLITIALVEVLPAIYMMARLYVLKAVSLSKELYIILLAFGGFIFSRMVWSSLGY
ncbi:oligosaccharide flippase family protein [Eionea flava]